MVLGLGCALGPCSCSCSWSCCCSWSGPWPCSWSLSWFGSCPDSCSGSWPRAGLPTNRRERRATVRTPKPLLQNCSPTLLYSRRTLLIDRGALAYGLCGRGRCRHRPLCPPACGPPCKNRGRFAAPRVPPRTRQAPTPLPTMLAHRPLPLLGARCSS